jgi:hypothetical protein
MHTTRPVYCPTPHGDDVAAYLVPCIAMVALGDHYGSGQDGKRMVAIALILWGHTGKYQQRPSLIVPPSGPLTLHPSKL